MRLIDRLWLWRPGQLGGGYEKFLLLCTSILDVQLIRVPQGASIPSHVDPMPGYIHRRLNITLREPEEGGEVKLLKAPRKWWRLMCFRPDHVHHQVTKVTRGELLVLSIGWLTETPE